MPGLLHALLNSIVFSVLGVTVFGLSFWIFDRLTPHDLWKEISEQRNVALGIVIGAMCLGISVIIAAAIHG